MINAFDHREGNPGLSILIRFCTNARPTVERPSPFPVRRRFGIFGSWENVRVGLEEPALLLNGLRAILLSTRKPDAINVIVWARFLTFVRTSGDDAILLEFVVAFEWDTGSGESDELEPRITQRLLADRHVPNLQDAGSPVSPSVLDCYQATFKALA